jgi:hypothetical protein
MATTGIALSPSPIEGWLALTHVDDGMDGVHRVTNLPEDSRLH